MLRRITVLIFVLALLPVFLTAQNRAILKPSGKIIKLNDKEALPVVSSKAKTVTTLKKVDLKKVLANPDGTLDTLQYNTLMNSTANFGIAGQDVLLQWFQAPADLNIRAVGINPYDIAAGSGLEVKVVAIGNGWTASKLKAQNDKIQGYWIAKGNGFNDIAPYEEEATDPKTWVAHSAGSVSCISEDLWSDNGQGAPVQPEDDGDYGPSYQWVSMDLLGFYPEVKGGDIFGVCVKNTFTTLDDGSTPGRYGNIASTDPGFDGWKYYANGRSRIGDTSDAGWWSRTYTWDFGVAVEITGDLPPAISGVTNLHGTLSTGPIDISATITDQNPGGGAAGVKAAYVVYSTSADTNKQQVAMTANGDVYTGAIPGQAVGTTIDYKIMAVDVNDNVSYSPLSYSYYIFAPTPGVTTLMVLNGWSFDNDPANLNEYPQNYYFGISYPPLEVYPFKHDIWAYGPLSAELVNNYTNILEFATPEPNDDNADVIGAWLSGGATRNYFICGQEVLGKFNQYTDQDFAAGTFQYDVLGITHSYNDVSYVQATAVGDDIPSRLTATAGSVITGPMEEKFLTLGVDSLDYDPYYEFSGAVSNWIDGFDVISGQDVDAQVETRGIGYVDSVVTLPCATHRVLPAGNKIVFFAFDPLALDTSPYGANYYWLGLDPTSPQIQVLNWFGIESGVEKLVGNNPAKFALSQNYPNPFNPTTTITYSVPQRSNVTLKVYDMLGREVMNLVTGMKDKGTYEVSFDASNLASGLYIYSISAGSFSASRKMMLLK
jgi:hypothetical protein